MRILLSIACGVACSIMAKEKGHNRYIGFVVGFIFTIFGLMYYNEAKIKEKSKLVYTKK